VREPNLPPAAYGGEEFGPVLPEPGTEIAARGAEDIRVAMSGLIHHGGDRWEDYRLIREYALFPKPRGWMPKTSARAESRCTPPRAAAQFAYSRSGNSGRNVSCAGKTAGAANGDMREELGCC